MSATKPYALPLPSDTARQLAKAKTVQVTNVEPLTNVVLATLYQRRADENESVPGKAVAAYQSQEEPD